MKKKYSKILCFIIGSLFVIGSSPLILGFSISYEPPTPITISCYYPNNGTVKLIAVHMGDVGIDATYYSIDGGEEQEYVEPFQIPEGTHTIVFYSVDKNGNCETKKTMTYTFDIFPPTIEILEPDRGIYILGNKVLDFGKSIYVGGDVTVRVNADDGPGVGVQCVFFSYSNNDSGFDDNASDGWSDTFTDLYFGNITITARAMDKKGFISDPVSTTITLYSLGIF